MTSGQRCVIIPDPSYRVYGPLVLLNFNQNDVAKLHTAEKQKYKMMSRRDRLVRRKREENRGIYLFQTQSVYPNYWEVYSDMVGDSIPDDPDDEKGGPYRRYCSRELDGGIDLDDDSDDGDGPTRNRVKSKTQPGRLYDHKCFQNTVYSRLSFTVWSMDSCTFDGAILDEEGILGLGVRISFVGDFMFADLDRLMRKIVSRHDVLWVILHCIINQWYII